MAALQFNFSFYIEIGLTSLKKGPISMENLSRTWASFVINNRVLILVLTAITMIISIVSIISNPPPYNNSSEIWFLEDDPDLKAFYEMQEMFGDSEYMAVGIEARPTDKDVFEADTVNKQMHNRYANVL